MKKNANKYDLRNILHSSKHKITFISNPKVACSTIKNSLLGGFDGDVHAEANKRFGLPQDTEHDFFASLAILTAEPYLALRIRLDPTKRKTQMLFGILFAIDSDLNGIFNHRLRIS